MVPTVFSWLLALPHQRRTKYDVSSLTHVLHGGAKCTVTVKRKMIEWLGPILHEIYAATEIGSTHVCSEDWLQRPGTVGRPCPGTTVRILSEQGVEVGVGEPGIVYMRRDGDAFEYHNDPAATSASQRDGFATAGDFGYFDGDGWLYLLDRRCDVIISAGINVYPAEVEDVLLAHPAVADAVVFGMPHRDYGQLVAAVVEPASNVSGDRSLAADLHTFCRRQLARYKCPQTIEFGDLQQTVTGKSSRSAIRERFLAGRADRVNCAS
jgi:long-chain acyl-CoA synthetase